MSPEASVAVGKADASAGKAGGSTVGQLVTCVSAITGREMSSLFFSPIAYIVIAIFLVVTGIFFTWQTFQPGQEATLRNLMDNMPLILVFVLPMLTMRLMSEEFRSGTIESLMTAPVTDTAVILGKFVGVLLFYAVMLLTTVPYWMMVGLYGSTDIGGTLTGYFGLLLLGSTYLAVGLFFSTCTRNQVIAVLSSFVLLAIFTFLAQFLASRMEGTLRVVVQYGSIVSHYQDFARGMIVFNDALFFVSNTVLFLFLAVKVLESRRWR